MARAGSQGTLRKNPLKPFPRRTRRPLERRRHCLRRLGARAPQAKLHLDPTRLDQLWTVDCE